MSKTKKRSKTPAISCYVNEFEAEVLSRLADLHNRSMSNMLLTLFMREAKASGILEEVQQEWEKKGKDWR